MLGKERLENETVKRAERSRFHPKSVFSHLLKEDALGMEIHNSGFGNEVSRSLVQSDDAWPARANKRIGP